MSSVTIDDTAKMKLHSQQQILTDDKNSMKCCSKSHVINTAVVTTYQNNCESDS